jgi:outer membrane immunogenic protein
LAHKIARRFRLRLLATVAGSALIGAPALAQTGPMTWSGFYAGLNAGYMDSNINVSDRNAVLTGGHDSGASGSAAGGMGGVQGGYNWQMSSFVLGVEGDFDIAGATEMHTLTAGFFRQRVSELGTLRARLGYAFNSMPVMIYGTGGFAFSNVTDTAFSRFVTPYPDRATWRTGWTAGGGGEWMFAPGWSLKAEVLYVDMGSSSIIDSSRCALGFKDNAIVARGGFNFHF